MSKKKLVKKQRQQNKKYTVRIVNGKRQIETINKNEFFEDKSDFGTEEFKKRNILGYEFVDSQNPRNQTKRAVNKTQTGLDWLFMRHYIDKDQYKAGSLLYIQFEKAGIFNIPSTSFDKLMIGRVDGGKDEINYTEAQIHYRKKLREIHNYLGNDLGSVVFHVCCWSASISDVEDLNKWRSGTGREVLKIGLNQLARYYGICR